MSDTLEKPHYTGHRKRLRERFLTVGADALADYELLEMILFPAKPLGDVKPMAKALLAKFGSFAKVLLAEQTELMKVEGVNEAAVVAIKTTKSAAERMLKEDISDRPLIKSWTQLLDYCRIQMGHLQNEEFHILFLNHKLELIAHELQQKGTINHTSVYPREVVKRALELVTKQIIQAAKALNIEVHDHLIIGGKKHFSFKSKGII